MENSSPMGDRALSAQETPPAFEYGAQVASPFLNGEGKLVVGDDAVKITALFDIVELPYADVQALIREEHSVTLRTKNGDIHFSRLGSWCEAFYAEVLAAYNKKVLKALFVQGQPLLETAGEVRYVEDGAVFQTKAPVQVYENCVCILPPDLHARRVPLCFVTGMEKKEYTVTLRLDTGDTYTFAKLGYDTDPFAVAVEAQIRKVRETALAAVKKLDPALAAAQASALARLMPEGVAAPMGKLAAVAPAFVSALEAALAASRAAGSYSVFKEMCDPAQIFLGFKKSDGQGAADGAQAEEKLPAGQGVPGMDQLAGLAGMLATGTPDNTDGSDKAQEELMLWMIAPSPDGRACAVEFAGGQDAAAATFVYRFDGRYEDFAGKLNRALEATAFKREVIRLSEEDLLLPQNDDYRMAVQRTRAIQLIRAGFAGRAIHTGQDSWKKQVLTLWGN